jgi:hypothetical protein
MEYMAYFDHSSYGSDEFFCVKVELESPSLIGCLDTLNQVWEVATSSRILPDDSFLAEVRCDGELVWSHTDFE